MRGKLLFSTLVSLLVIGTPTVSFASTKTQAPTSSSTITATDQTPIPPSTQVTNPNSTGPMVNTSPKVTTGKNAISPLSTVTLDNGSATLTAMQSNQSFAWKLTPFFIGPWEYNLTITAFVWYGGAYREVGAYSWSGASFDGTVSGIVPYSYLGLSSGDYFCELSGNYYYDPGSGSVGEPGNYPQTNIIVN